MKYHITSKPYPEGTVHYEPSLSKKEGRLVVSIIFPDGSRTTCSNARFVMQCHLKRFLTKDETVDHIDENKLNDSLDNLQVISLCENSRKHRRYKNIKKKMVYLMCPECGIEFHREFKQTFLAKKQGHYTACSRSCSGRLGNKIRLGNEIDLSQNVIKIYEIDCK